MPVTVLDQDGNKLPSIYNGQKILESKNGGKFEPINVSLKDGVYSDFTGPVFQMRTAFNMREYPNPKIDKKSITGDQKTATLWEAGTVIVNGVEKKNLRVYLVVGKKTDVINLKISIGGHQLTPFVRTVVVERNKGRDIYNGTITISQKNK